MLKNNYLINDLLVAINDNEVWIGDTVFGELYEYEGQFSVHDGAEGYGWHDTIEQALEQYVSVSFKELEDESILVDCQHCGDGGCFHCEPHRFL